MAAEVLINEINKISEIERKCFSDLFKKFDFDFKDKKIHINWHLTRATLLMIAALKKAGAHVTVSATGGLAQHQETIDVIKKANIEYFDSEQKVLDYYKNNSPDIYFDCGAKFLGKLKPHKYGIELTHTDPKEYEKLSYPVFNIDNSVTKLIETKFGTGQAFINTLKNHYKKTDLEKNKQFVVFGYGKVGSGIVKALLGDGVPKDCITVIDPSEESCIAAKTNNIPYIQLSDKNMRNIKTKLKEAYCVVTATGVPGAVGQYFNPDDFSKDTLKCNMGTDDEWGPKFDDNFFLGKSRKLFNFILEYPTQVKYLEIIFYLAFITAQHCLAEQTLPQGLNNPYEEDDIKAFKFWQNTYGINLMRLLDNTDLRNLPYSFVVNLSKEFPMVDQSKTVLEQPYSETVEIKDDRRSSVSFPVNAKDMDDNLLTGYHRTEAYLNSPTKRRKTEDQKYIVVTRTQSDNFESTLSAFRPVVRTKSENSLLVNNYGPGIFSPQNNNNDVSRVNSNASIPLGSSPTTPRLTYAPNPEEKK